MTDDTAISAEVSGMIGTIQLGDMTSAATVTVHSPIPDDHPYFASIGRITARMAQFDHVIDIMVWDLSGTDQATASVITGKFSDQKSRFKGLRKYLAIRGLFERFEPQVAALQALAKSAQDRRNRVTHDPWYIDNDGNAAQLRSTARELNFGFNNVPEAEILGLVAEIDNIISVATDLRIEVFHTLNP